MTEVLVRQTVHNLFWDLKEDPYLHSFDQHITTDHPLCKARSKKIFIKWLNEWTQTLPSASLFKPVHFHILIAWLVKCSLSLIFMDIWLRNLKYLIHRLVLVTPVRFIPVPHLRVSVISDLVPLSVDHPLKTNSKTKHFKISW